MAERHGTDLVSLVAGLVTVTTAALFFVDDSGLARVDGAVVGAAAVVVLGLVALVGSVRRLLRSSGQNPPG